MSFEFEIKDKGRVVLPAGLRHACGFSTGMRVVGRPLGPGQAVVETVDAVLARIWANAPDEDVDAVGELLRWRADERLGASPAITTGSEAREASTLAALGLD